MCDFNPLPALATAADVIAGKARYADTPGGHADARTLAGLDPQPRTEYGASYTGDDPQHWSPVRDEIEIEMAYARAEIIAGRYDPDDYEPIVLMSRERTTIPDRLTAWRPVLDPQEL